MTTLREAAQQALEALLTYEQYIQPLTNHFGGPRVPEEGSASAKVDAAITALRAALEADDGMYGAKALTKAYENGWNAAKAEPVQEQPVCDECGKSKSDGWALFCVGCVEPMFVSKAEPVQEPVAWIYEFYADMGHKGLAFEEQPSAHNTPLYTAPLQRKPLTGEQLKQLELSLRVYSDNDRYDLSLHDFARAIERAHGITP